jgi:hypothetical protein
MSENTRDKPHGFAGANWINFRTSRRDRSDLHEAELRWLPYPTGGARRDRTDDLLLAKQALSQLSYGPSGNQKTGIRDQEGLFLTPGA